MPRRLARRATRHVPRKRGPRINTVPGEKWCPRCRRYRPVDQFGVCASRYDGLSGWCRPCRALNEQSRRKADVEGYRELTRARYAAHPERWHAKVAVARAVAAGTIRKPAMCPACGKARTVEAHHHRGYEKRFWLDVVWRCRQCHTLEHKRGVAQQQAA